MFEVGSAVCTVDTCDLELISCCFIMMLMFCMFVHILFLSFEQLFK